MALKRFMEKKDGYDGGDNGDNEICSLRVSYIHYAEITCRGFPPVMTFKVKTYRLRNEKCIMEGCNNPHSTARICDKVMR